MILFSVGLMIGLVVALVGFLLANLKINDIYSEHVTILSEAFKERSRETERADLLAKANEDLQEELNALRLCYSRMYGKLDMLKARIRYNGHAREYDLSAVEMEVPK